MSGPSPWLERRVIAIHAQAPSKPASGAPCNGCGLCCLTEPCPLGMLVSRRRHGACQAVRWVPEAGQYRCGLIVAPRESLPRGLRWLAPWWARWSRRWIAAGVGCDATIDVEDPADVSAPRAGPPPPR